ncbi:bifunctional uroporphyrinogen-III C-methyltransferase/uroporphyrinogen-III synthase [Calidifontibacter sp. DB0510]|uniref:uroporphyrinogen-III C-methyltransferase n=1 Tax=Metallococcus carri TaxID=1656884 RepID=A0A967B0R3_9MICO|nr:bifunctional uroporphyrinogen-III C-methyltransferase/uroporphyrinogen-III synthase [Metallococcus carri]NHN55318.1 bifunctional uroporphyrinogen-III C-methyltransferase/uroporphyrinogen-III synthase [Metallococcus carri]NOP36395.1 bifunctional uroporphyrinogen-III C-methyltransferase/uroporphyrinogen-III synthase [Calidifontibacter sp. DB2511S]
MSTTTKIPASIAFIGSGPGDPGLLTLRAAELLGRADVVVTDTVAREDFLAAHVREDVEIVDASHGDTGAPLTVASRAKLIVRTAKAAARADRGTLVVRLMDGDPATFNGLAEEALACHKAGFSFEIVPGVSAVSAVPAYAGVPLTQNGSRAIHVLSAGDSKIDWSRSADDATTVVLLGALDCLRDGLTKLAAAGRSEETQVALTVSGTTIHQSTITFTLAEVAKATKAIATDRPVVAVVGAPVALREQLSWWERKPLFGWNVLVPRTKDQAGSMVHRLADFGATSDVVPTISVEPPRTPQQMERAIKGLVTGRYEWIGFTSANAVRAVREKFVEYGLDARAFAGLKIAAVGGVTAESLREWGLEPDLVPSGEQSAKGLLEEWPEFDEVLDPINRVFLPRADIATDTLVAGLQEMGWEVDDVTAYRTVRAAPPAPEVREAIKTGKFDAVCFTSSSTVRNLVGIAGKPHATTVVACIGPATAKTAEEHGLRVDVMASEPTAEALVEALADYGRSLALAAEEAGEPLRRPSEKKATSRRKAKA